MYCMGLYCIAYFEYMFRENENYQTTKLTHCVQLIMHHSRYIANHVSFNLRVVGVEEDTDTTDTFSGIVLRVLFMVCLNTATV